MPSPRARLGAETVYLLVSVVAITVAVTLWLLDIESKGVYAILAGIFGACFVGYVVRSAESRVIRALSGEHEQASGLDEESIQAARRISGRLLRSDGGGS